MTEQVIREFWDSELPVVVDRDIDLDEESELINDIVGVRRSGKTFLMFNKIRELQKKAGKEATIYINFENRKLSPPKTDCFNDIIDFVYKEKLLQDHDKIYLFLDEVQRVKGWEKYIRSIYDEFKGRIKIFVSGSSANLLTRDYGKLLTGRHITRKVFPLSFKEFLRFKNFGFKQTEKKISETKKFLEEYLRYGGFPEVVLSNKKEELLNQLFTDLLARDVLGRAEVRKEQILEEFTYYLASNISNLLSFNKMSNYFKSRGMTASVPTLQNYFNLLKNAFVFFDNTIFSYKVKDQLQYPRKIYCIDNGLPSLVGFKFSEDIGKLYENCVAVELLRSREYSVENFYWQNHRNREVDFVVKKGTEIAQLIQVCCDLEDEETKYRETESLLRASEDLDCKNLLVITSDYKNKERLDKRTINYIPLWEWLLSK